MVFGNKRWQSYPWDGLVVIWDPSDCLALYDEYMGTIYGFLSTDLIGGNWRVSDLVL